MHSVIYEAENVLTPEASKATRVWLGSEMSGFMTAFAINMCLAYPRPEVFV